MPIWAVLQGFQRFEMGRDIFMKNLGSEVLGMK